MKWRCIRTCLSILLIFMLIGTSYLAKGINIKVLNEGYELPIFSVEKEEKVVSISFDVNWAEQDYLNSILDILDKYNVKATFFIMGGWANYSEENLTKLKLIHERGHEIGNHSYKHPMFSCISESRMIEELKKTDEIIENTIGEKPKLFRFPSGDYNKRACKVVNDAGYIPIQWDVDSVDWKEQGAEVEYNRVKNNIKPGSIVLFHNNAKYTPNNLDKILQELRANGYNFQTVGQLIWKENYYIDENGTQHRK
ncbi:polysaccharide deacetylase family protein [Clostridium sp. SHJSY1]|uniref:polysaccharide deacetylase family protein n=1 Tax=Clostridium sp. SHJSY1 TaxID=2942483 RepID=UPI0028767393|nr:polysaccharide deacetylase family protein [Clostridium sp. SHJSY1]MDS0527518.1 polysaccharide deacetylase family protein [Clostridium sp. SHJSY1]